MAKLSKDDVRKIANLIKLNIPESELEHYQEQLNTVLKSVEVLKELDTTKTEETAQTHGLMNVVAEDEPEPGIDISEYPNRKNMKDNYFKVNRVIS